MLEKVDERNCVDINGIWNGGMRHVKDRQRHADKNAPRNERGYGYCRVLDIHCKIEGGFAAGSVTAFHQLVTHDDGDHLVAEDTSRAERYQHHAREETDAPLEPADNRSQTLYHAGTIHDSGVTARDRNDHDRPEHGNDAASVDDGGERRVRRAISEDESAKKFRERSMLYQQRDRR